MEKPNLLLVDDHPHILNQLRWALEDDFTVHTAQSKEEALGALRRVAPRLLTIDLSLAPGDEFRRQGFEVLQAALAADAAVKAIVVTSEQEEATAVQAVQMGAFDYFVKPVPLDELRAALKRAAYLVRLERQAAAPESAASDDLGIVGGAPATVELRTVVRRAAQTGFTVLVEGESGTGKELIARAVWQQSPRRTQPFVVVNCAAIPEQLLESELFGHEKGSFTGAHALKKGKFELADGGTLFLDEIGELGLGLQAKLLRFLQDKTIERVGGRRPIQLDVRIVAATNRDLERAVQTRAFRDDLYYRLKVLPIQVPPLRDRVEDILPLANYFLDRVNSEARAPRKRLSRSAEEALQCHGWPGNVRELENAMSAGVVRSLGNVIGPQHFGLGRNGSAPCDLREARDELERVLIERALRRNSGVVSRAAKDLSISRVTLYDLLAKHGLRTKGGERSDG